MKILVVDDEPAILTLAAEILTTLNTSVQTAAGLQEAKDEVTRDRFDLVISDLSMSGCTGMEGLELLSHIKNISGETEVFIMTGFGSDDVRKTAYARGALWFAEKPLNIKDLRSKVQDVAVRKGLAVP